MKATVVSATVLVFCTVIVIVVVPPTAKVEAVNDFVTTGAASTVRLAFAVRLPGPSTVCTNVSAAPLFVICEVVPVLVVAIVICLWIAARISAAGVLTYGQKPGARALFAAAFASRR